MRVAKWCALLTACAWIGSGCGNSSGGRCVANEQRSCGCPDGSQGFQTCTPEGKAFNECTCAGPDGGSGGAAGSTGSGGVGGESGGGGAGGPFDGGAGAPPDGGSRDGAGGDGAIQTDGSPDATPCTSTDTDGDGVADTLELTTDSDGDGLVDFADPDSDDDGIPDSVEAGLGRSMPCDALVDSDNDGAPDLRDLDSDDDWVLDEDESSGCRLLGDCDASGVADIIEVAAGSDPTSASSEPATPEDFVVVPFGEPSQTTDLRLSSAFDAMDVYVLLDTTTSMQPAIDNLRAELSNIVRRIVRGDSAPTPAIPSIPRAWFGLGDFNDVPWSPWGTAGDRIYGFRFDLGGTGNLTYGNVSEPVDNAGTPTPPSAVSSILAALGASGGGDAPEAMTQALWLASTNQDYRAVGGGEPWPPNDPPGSGIFDASEWRKNCADPTRIGRACFRPSVLPVFVVITDAGTHNGPTPAFDYQPPPIGNVNGTKTYVEVLANVNAIGAKVLGVPVNTGTPGQARNDLVQVARDTGALYFDSVAAGEVELVGPEAASGAIGTEVVRLVGLLESAGVRSVTTTTTSYSCTGGVDCTGCTGDGVPDPAFSNFIDPGTSQPFDASQLIESVTTVDTTPSLYNGRDASMFFGVRGGVTLTFRIATRNNVFSADTLRVARVLIDAHTPDGHGLGGSSGSRTLSLILPRSRSLP